MSDLERIELELEAIRTQLIAIDALMPAALVWEAIGEIRQARKERGE